MREGESSSSFGIGFYTEGVFSAGDEVEDETDDIGYGVGCSGKGMIVVAELG